MTKVPKLFWTKPLRFDEAIRAVICMIPMIIGLAIGRVDLIAALGQGGFYYAYLPLPEKKGKRLLFSSFLIALGLGFYLMGGNVTFNPVLAVVFTFLVGMNLVFLSSWKMLGPLAFTFISIYAAGLNAGSPEKVHASFLAFVISLGFAALVSMLPIWKGTASKELPEQEPEKQVETAFRMGFGVAIAEGISQLFEFGKMGWAPSGVGNVIRFDGETSKKRAWLRMGATVAGVGLLAIVMFISIDLVYLAVMALIFSFINGLTKDTKLGQTITMYTVTILILYSLNNLPATRTLAVTRVTYNLLGVLIGVLFVMYPFPRLMEKVRNSVN